MKNTLGNLQQLKKNWQSDSSRTASELALEGKLEKARIIFAKAAQSSNSPEVLKLAAIFYVRIGDLDEAEKLLRRGLMHLQEEDASSILIEMSQIYYIRGELESSETTCRMALEIDEKLGNLAGMANGYGNLGILYNTRGDLVQAEVMFEKALEIDEKLGNIEGLSSLFSNMGILYIKRGELDRAEEMYNKSLELNEKLGRLDDGKFYGNLGILFKDRREFEKARKNVS